MKRSILPWLGLAAIAAIWSAILRGDEPAAPYRRATTVPAWCVQVSVMESETQGRQVVSCGSGVVVSTEGHILTCQHIVGDSARAKVMFPDGTSAFAAVLQRGLKPGFDLAVVKVSSKKPLTAVPLAWGSPAQGDPVDVWGYPDGVANHHTTRVAQVRAGYDATQDPPQRGAVESPCALLVDRPFIDGASGGAVLNAAGELLGISSAREHAGQRGLAIGSTECARILFRAGVTTRVRRPRGFLLPCFRPQLWVIHTDNCAGCVRFDQDFGSKSQFRRFLETRWRVHFLDGRRAQRWVARMRITAFPAFVFSNSQTVIFGYENEQAFIKELIGEQQKDPESVKKTCRFTDMPDVGEEDCELPHSPGLLVENPAVEQPPIAQISWGTPTPPAPVVPVEVPPPPPPQPVIAPPPLSPATQPVSTAPNPPSGEDLGLCRVVWLVPQLSIIPQFLGGAVAKAELFSSQLLLRDRLATLTGGRVQAGAVLQRVEPARYAAVAKSTGLDPKLGGLVVLAPKSFTGLAGSAAGAIEKTLEGLSLFKSLPIAEVFERTNQPAFDAVQSDLTRDYSESSEDPIGPGGYSGGLLAILLYHVNRYFRGEKSKGVAA